MDYKFKKMDEMKRNLLMNSFFITFGIIFAISAQEKTPQIEKNIRVTVNGDKVTVDTMSWTIEKDLDLDFEQEFFTHSDSTHKVTIIKKGNDKQKMITVNTSTDQPGNEMLIETLVDENGDSSVIKTIVIKSQDSEDFKFRFPEVPPVPNAPDFKFITQMKDPLGALLEDSDYEIIDFRKKEKNGVETIRIKRKRKY